MDQGKLHEIENFLNCDEMHRHNLRSGNQLMTRYTRPQGTESRQGRSQNAPRSRQVSSGKPSQPAKPDIAKPIWKNPLVWLGVAGASLVLGYPIWEDQRLTRVISVYAVDVSDSGIANPEAVKAVCKAHANRSIAGDVSITFEFSDRTENTGSQTIDSNSDLSQQCQTVFTGGTERSKQISKRGGTDPIAVIDRIENAVVSERAKGNQNPVVVTLWLDDAEPVAGKPAYDFDDFQKQVEAIASDRGKVAIIGTTGELAENLEKRFAKNSSVFLCTAKDSADCIRKTFEAARTPKT